MQNNLTKRFFKHVKKTSTCWLWIGNKIKSGYGLFSIDGKRFYAHRVSWTIENGTIPFGKNILHRCDNPPCVRPGHLFDGTQRDNSIDMLSKKRGRSYGRLQVLDPQKVLWIRRQYATGEFTTYELADVLKISQDSVASVLNGKHWKHVTE